MHTQTTNNQPLAPESLQRRSPQSGSPNFVLGPGGQASIVSTQGDATVVAAVAPVESPIQSQSGASALQPLANGTPSIAQATQSQPQTLVQTTSAALSTLTSESAFSPVTDTTVVSVSSPSSSADAGRGRRISIKLLSLCDVGDRSRAPLHARWQGRWSDRARRVSRGRRLATCRGK